MTTDGPRGADLERLGGLDAAKWTRYPSEVIPAWVADMDFAPPEVAVDAMQRVLDRGDVGYNHTARLALPEAFSNWQAESHGWQPDPSELVLFNDVLHAIEFTIWHRTRPGDGVVLFAPIYPPFIAALENSGRRPIWCPLDPTSRRLDPSMLDGVCDERTTAVLWCNPHNPTGRAFDDDELDGLAEVVRRRGLLVIADEVWADLVYSGAHHRPAALHPGLAPATITVSSASKSFNLAGMRTAVAHLGHEETRREFLAQPTHLRGQVNTLGAEASVACWTEGRPWLDELRRLLEAQRDHLVARLRSEIVDAGVYPPEATYLAWLDLTRVGFGAVPSKHLLDHGGVALSSGNDFGPGGEGHARLNFATSRAVLDLVIDRVVGAPRVEP